MARRRSAEPAPVPRRVRAGLVLTVLGPAAGFLPTGLGPFSLPKLAITAVGACLALSARGHGRLPRTTAVLLGVGAVVVVAAALLGPAPGPALVGRFPRYEGLPHLVVCGAVLCAWARWPVADLLVVALRATVALLLPFAVLEALGSRPLGTDGSRVASLAGNATDLGLIGVVAAAVLLVATRERRDLLWVAGALALVVLSGSRAALLAALLCLVVAGARADLRRTAAVAGLALVVGALALPTTRERLEGTDRVAYATVTGRELLWGSSLRLAAREPLLGVGPSGFVDTVGAVQDEEWSRRVGPANPVDSPHDLVLQLLVVGGVPLLLVGLLLTADGVRRGWPRRHQVLGPVAGLAGGAAVLLTHVTGPATVPLLAALGGVVVTEAARADRRAWPVPAVLAGACALLLVPAALAEVPARQGVEDLVAGGSGDAFEVARALRPWDVDLLLQEGHARAVLVEGGATDPAAVGAARRTTRSLPSSTEAWLDLARALEASDDLPGAREALARAGALSPTNADVVLRDGVVAARSGDLATAEARFVRATSLAPRDPVPWRNLARVYRLAGDESRALMADAEAARRSP